MRLTSYLILNNTWVLNQDAELSHFELTIEPLRFSVLPVSIKKVKDSAGLTVQDAQRVRFVTNTGLEVLTQPALQAPSALLSALAAFDVSEFTVQANGNLQIPAAEGIWFSVRPDWLSTELDAETETGLKIGESPYENGFILASLVFTDNQGKYRKQLIPPAIAQPDMLHSLAKNVSLKTDGLVSFKLDKTYHGMVDYAVTQGEEAMTDTLQVESIPDANGDGIADVVLIYPNSERQILFVVE
ncbi:MAG: hypothetical protein DRR19_31265 [Candidatus Parabeggiatoa sp. nov. 1]|nr:MAG: hypothetical protein DRR19_31265 [Gammaproteobacteria bacterium]